jgi:hypothetical protein
MLRRCTPACPVPEHRHASRRTCFDKQLPALQVAAAHSHLDLLINASGILHDSSMTPETGLARVSMDNLLKCFQVVISG